MLMTLSRPHAWAMCCHLKGPYPRFRGLYRALTLMLVTKGYTNYTMWAAGMAGTLKTLPNLVTGSGEGHFHLPDHLDLNYGSPSLPWASEAFKDSTHSWFQNPRTSKVSEAHLLTM